MKKHNICWCAMLKGSLNGWMIMKLTWIMSCSLQPPDLNSANTCRKFWSDVLDSTLTTITNWWEILWMNFHLSSRDFQSLQNSSEALLDAYGGITPYWDAFLFICHPSVVQWFILFTLYFLIASFSNFHLSENPSNVLSYLLDNVGYSRLR